MIEQLEAVEAPSPSANGSCRHGSTARPPAGVAAPQDHREVEVARDSAAHRGDRPYKEGDDQRRLPSFDLIPRDIVPIVAWQWTATGWTPAVGLAHSPPSPITTRWLDTRDVRGWTKTRPIRFDGETLAWLALDAVRVALKPFGAAGEPGRKRKNVTLVDWTVDDGAADEGWLDERENQGWMSRLPRRTWRQRAAKAEPDHPAIQSARV